MNKNGNAKITGKAVAKTTAKSTVEVGTLVPQAHGGALRHGGTNKGGPGRPSNAFKKGLEKARARGTVLKYFTRCLDGKEGPAAHLKALEFASDRLDGKVPNVTQAQGGDEPLIIRVVTGP